MQRAIVLRWLVPVSIIMALQKMHVGTEATL